MFSSGFIYSLNYNMTTSIKKSIIQRTGVISDEPNVYYW